MVHGGIRVEGRRKTLCWLVCLACMRRERERICDDYIATAERSVIIHIIGVAVAAKKAANKNVFTWRIKCNCEVHGC